MKSFVITALVFFSLGFSASDAHAKIFRNAYVQFELPDLWNCNMEGTEWVCSSQNKNDAKESIIILTSKEVGPQDSFPIYEKYLKTSKSILLPNGKSALSQIKNVHTRKINDQQWVDALHLSSEIPGYYTRYLATIKDKLAILVTFSAHQKYYTKYSNDFFKAVESLRVVFAKDLLNPKGLAAPLSPGSEKIGQNLGASLPEVDVDNTGGDNGGAMGSGTYVIFAGILLLLAVLAYYLLKRNRKQ